MSQSFIVACEGGKRKIAEILLEKQQVDVKYTDERGRTALHYAAYQGYTDIVKQLIEAGADINYEDHHGETPLFFAVTNKQKQTILHLLDNGANPEINDFQGNSLLHILAKTGQQDVAEKLIGLGLDVNALNKDGTPPLLIATRNKFIPIVKLLMQNCADIDFTDKMGVLS